MSNTVAVWLPGLPAPYDGSSIESITLYLKSVSDFLSSPLARLVCQCHPNHIALVSGPSANIPPRGTFSSWWSYFDTMGVKERHMQYVRSEPLAISEQDPLKEFVSSGTLPDSAPASLKDFIQTIRTSQLDRTSDHFSRICVPRDNSRGLSDSFIGMSPKKFHEVSRLSLLVRTIALQCPDRSQMKVVDVGSGQGYLSYEIASPNDLPQGEHSVMEILALESDEHQLNGARKRALVRDTRRSGKGIAPAPITYIRAHISNTDSLKAPIDNWMTMRNAVEASGKAQEAACQFPASVIFTGLHACGSLTPTMLRAFADLANGVAVTAGTGIQTPMAESWCPSGLALVGCCYNLLQPSDFPLSASLQDSNLVKLHVQHLQLACQWPMQWTLSHDAWEKSKFARRKIVYRALLGRLVSSLQSNVDQSDPGWSSDEDLRERMEQWQTHLDDLDGGRATTGSATLAGMRLGRMNAQQYTDWPTFLHAALNRLITQKQCLSSPLSHLHTVDLGKLREMTVTSTGSSDPVVGAADDSPRGVGGHEFPAELPSRLACLHVLRAMIGPLIESLIIADRVLFLVENLRKQPVHHFSGPADSLRLQGGDCTERQWTWRVSAINLFEPQSGSDRNVAILAEKVWA